MITFAHFFFIRVDVQKKIRGKFYEPIFFSKVKKGDENY